jgi:nicotinate dehydrogenase subunit B
MMKLARRDVVKGVGGLVVALVCPGVPAWAQTPAGQRESEPVDGFLHIATDGRVTLYTSKIDWGTGLRAAFRQLVAEELDIGVGTIDMIESDTARTPNQGGTGGSYSINPAGLQIRQAAATARAALLGRAAAQLGAPVGSLKVSDGIVAAPNGQTVSYGALLAGGRLDMRIDPKAPLKSYADYKVVGQSVPRPDVPAKVSGSHIYVHDFRLPGMLHGRVVRPSAHGARVIGVDEASIANIDAARVVRLDNFLGVVAESEWAAVRAARALKVTWSEWQGLPDQASLYKSLRAAQPLRVQRVVDKGDVDRLLAEGGRVLRASYDWPIQNHASIGPSCAVADVRDGRATIWTASSNCLRYKVVFARFLGLKADDVRLIYMDGAGAFGMNGAEDAAADAALLSQAVGRPVRVQWMREDEHRWEPKGPPQPVDLAAVVDDAGNLKAWHAETWLPAATQGLQGVPLLGPAAAGRDQAQGLSTGLLAQHLDPPYAVEALRFIVNWLPDTPLRPAHIRAPGKVANSFAAESFIDEIAATASADPLAWRLARLSDERGIAVLRRAAELFGWQPRTAGSRRNATSAKTRGSGISYVHYKNREAYVALAFEVEVDRETGVIRILRGACAQDCGMVINPDGVKAQIEGAVVQTISRTLKEEVTFSRTEVTSLDWASYPLLTWPEAPDIAISLIDRPGIEPVGVGEPAAAPVPAAIANAVFDAIGVRLRQVPFTPERVLSALAVGLGR